MSSSIVDVETRNKIIAFQKNEITEYFVYKKLADSTNDLHNREILMKISGDELKHYNTWMEYTGEDTAPDKIKLWKYVLISKIFGVTFGLKLMEKGEEQAQVMYDKLAENLPAGDTEKIKNIILDEDEHEMQLINLIDEERLRYAGSMVLGLNDALVELTGALAGFTLALRNTQLIAMVGLITGVAASLSMAASEYLSTKTDESRKNPFKAAVYTGFAYVLTVMFLILPFLIFSNLYICLGFTIFNAILIVFIFTFYISVAKDLPFRKRFFEMAAISIGIAALTFCIGFFIRFFFNVEI
jgi:VIT1/CCC1 family predicted Fe2+/Mn2+ transporter